MKRSVSNNRKHVININGRRDLVVEGGMSLFETLKREQIFLPSACGGRGKCGLCRLKVISGGGPSNQIEKSHLSAKESVEGVRLSCQVKVENDIRIEIPPELLSIREHTAICTRITDLTHDIKEFRLELNKNDEFKYVPGQYIQLRCPKYNGNEEVYRAYSISSNPMDRNAIELMIRLTPNGICTTWCFNYLKEGDIVQFEGPHGNFCLSDTDAPIVFVAGGSGMAPIKCMLHHMKNTGNNRKATFFFGLNLANELFAADLMKQFERDLPNFSFVPVIAQPENQSHWTGETGLVTEALKRNLKDASLHEAYLCGSPGMIDAAIITLTELGIPKGKIFYDRFA
ncbi:MAG: 2Fe-2S iron-sulfur cluster binding domain-containing protein [Lentisphaerae bacterium]|nr:2Fe-2S iron-sulfur cluster binding domain-containing protein [Lentisphaerota bacterium]